MRGWVPLSYGKGKKDGGTKGGRGEVTLLGNGVNMTRETTCVEIEGMRGEM